MGQVKTSALLRTLGLLLEDLLLLLAGTPELVRNVDIRSELEALDADDLVCVDRECEPRAGSG